MYYKITITKTCYVEADDIEEARDKALDGDFIIEDEDIADSEKITLSQMRRILVQMGDE